MVKVQKIVHDASDNVNNNSEQHHAYFSPSHIAPFTTDFEEQIALFKPVST